MDLRDLHWLVALAEHGHVTGTAESLEVSQPALSRALARMERELGTRLFERVSSGIVLTPDGEVALDAARDIVARHDQLTRTLADRLDPDSGTVRLAFLDSMSTSLVPRVLREFHAAAPAVRVLLTQEPHHDLVRDLESGAVELAITSWLPKGRFGWLPMQEERLVLVVPSTHRWRSRRRISLESLADEELVTTPRGFGYRGLVDDLMAAAGVSPRVSFESADLATIEGLVAAGLGVAVLPEQFVGHNGTIGIPLTTRSARRTIGLTWRTDRELAPPAARFVDFVGARGPARG
ncbi:LysR family transcriptional regulator [Knoellia subterranea]|uniref:LysR family transcriptional regulator n=1 Tax=Knoellia subterranea KCTC 19937 TaxID=1385521 RepID=A0A0A0JK92_9MICO|nr:LysR family transcriptional regulator [Knoellia subterranea]KGN36477.1 LysR family transcriptional regulator [Knoellia subterranea KCTC 19937]